MAGLYLADDKPQFGVERAATGEVELQISAGGVAIRITVGDAYDDVSLLADSLRHLAEDTEEIRDGWQDVPGQYDAYISFDRGRYYVSLEGSRVGDYPSRQVAEIALARAMVAGGVFPPAWYVTTHGNYVAIDADIRRWHDAGGDQMAPLAGVQYQRGDRVRYAPDGLVYVVIGDWGPAGVEIHTDGDRTIRAHVTDRTDLSPIED